MAMCQYDSGMIAGRVRAARLTLGLTQRYVGARIGLSQPAYQHYERARQKFTVKQILELSEILGWPAEWLLGLKTQLSDDEIHVLALYRRAAALGEGDTALRVLRGLVEREE